MLPTQLVGEVINGLKSYVTSGFETSTPYFSGMFTRFVNAPGKLYKGPWLSMSLPFKQGNHSRDFFKSFKTQFPPYLHQELAWKRIASDQKGRSTIIATGTGSGKTECFLYPMLDHCARQRQKGIKAIVIYPMNALATDQAKRFAKEIFNAPDLKGKLRVGLFVGGREEKTIKSMAIDSVITDKDSLRADPPDILLTNYKMLDFLLIRPVDRQLWRHNGPETLRYLVVDELHTFDGAQGTDLACLIRRLKGRLLTSEFYSSLICVGTSATLGSDKGAEELKEYAHHIFKSEFDSQSVITEQRQGTDEFLVDPIEFVSREVKDIDKILDPMAWPNVNVWLDRLFSFYFNDQLTQNWESKDARIALGRLLKRHLLFNNLLRLLSKAPLSSLDELSHEFSRILPEGNLKNNAGGILNSLCVLVATGLGEDGQPLVNLRLQIWFREMRRMVTPLKPVQLDGEDEWLPVLSYADDLSSSENELHLPLVQCNHCHATAWLTYIEEGGSTAGMDLRVVYQRWFSHDPESHVFFPLTDQEGTLGCEGLEHFFCLNCGYLQNSHGNCISCNTKNLQRIFQPNLRQTVRNNGVNRVVTKHHCPICEMKDSLMIFGARSVTLSSIAIHHLYSTPWNDDRKLIAFSDSVQDAAHRAGYFSSRTWINLVRMAMVQAMPDGNVSLVDFYQRFPFFWRDQSLNKNAMTPVQFVAEFIAPNMLWYQDYIDLTQKEGYQVSDQSFLYKDICKRLEWEVFAEFGYRSRIGRSLENTGSAALGIFVEPIDRSVMKLIQPFREKEGLVDLTERMLRDLLVGILFHMKQQGGIDQQFSSSYFENGKSFLLNRIPFLPDFAQSSRSPVYLTNALFHSEFELLISNNKKTWAEGWVHRVLGVDTLLPQGIEKILLPQVMEVLVEEGLIVSYEIRQTLVWALNPSQLYLSRKVSVFETENARDRFHAPEQMRELIEKMPSLQLNDTGHYKVAKLSESWLANIYDAGHIKRINSKEHTGLLLRDERQEIERDFIHGDKAWSCNLLSATPTLEMGIDIGDLSSLLLCSVPPSQANYLQRIGRAGRRDGNALAITIAEASSHDLYFYSDPLMMMAGDIEPPGVFLNAYAVISRQLTAYCMDQWVKTGIDESAIPKRMKQVLDGVDVGSADQFPYNFINYIEKNPLVLVDSFIELFDNELTKTTQNQLKDFILNQGAEDGLGLRLIKRLHELSEQRQGFINKIKQLKGLLTQLKRQPSDDTTEMQIEAVEIERAGFRKMLRNMNDKQPLNYLTDEGLIPNYAFPEAGVLLQSVIYRKRQNPKEGGKRFDQTLYEYERPSVAAIRELMPNSRFYAGARKVEIEQIDLEVSDIEMWRFCPECSYSTSEHQELMAECPKCNDPGWSDSGQLLEMARLRQVMANTDDRKSRIGDDSEERDTAFHVKQMLTDFSRLHVMYAYRIKSEEIPFGFEFVRKVTFREINFGEYGGSGEERSIAGISLVRPGYKICRHCGMVQNSKKLRSGETQNHSFTCKPGKKNPEEELNLIDCLYLYREFNSEALRILMPLSTIEDGDSSLHSFIAGLQLGLKLKFGGKVDHLRVMNYNEPSQELEANKRFLMVYDSVPGGTGYLQQLMDTPLLLLEIFKLARDHMVNCSCNQDEEKDGCYSCLYAYRNSYGMETTSRNRAVQMFDRILDKGDQIEPIATIDDIEINPILESELEARFIGAIRNCQIGRLNISIQQQVVNNKPGYFLKVDEVLYTIEPQVMLSESDGVLIPSKPDFLIRSAQSFGKGKDFKPIAVFLDGFKYHKKILAEDSAKRLAITKSNRYRIWSLTWDDVGRSRRGNDNNQMNPFTKGLHENMKPLQDQMTERLAIPKPLNDIPLKSSFEQLFYFLAEPVADWWMGMIMIRSISWFDQQKLNDSNWVKDVKARVIKNSPSSYVENIERDDQITAGSLDLGRLRLDLLLPIQAITTVKPEQLMVMIYLDDEFSANEEIEKKLWQSFLSLFNLMQFLPDSIYATQKGILSDMYEPIVWSKGEVLDDSEELFESEFTAVINEVSDFLTEGLLALNSLGVEVPVVGYEVMSEKNEVIGEVELAWETLKIAGVLGGQKDFLSEVDDRWLVLDLENGDDWVQQVKNRFEGVGK